MNLPPDKVTMIHQDADLEILLVQKAVIKTIIVMNDTISKEGIELDESIFDKIWRAILNTRNFSAKEQLKAEINQVKENDTLNTP
jgi:hypothetical protein